MSDQLHTPAAVPLELVWKFWRIDKCFTPTRTWTPDHPACSLFTILTMVPWLSHYSCTW